MRILVTGDRNWTDGERIKNVLKCFPLNTVLIHGNARGADKIAAGIAFDLGWEIIAFSAKWEKYGKAAGVKRNREMYDTGKPDIVIAFHNDLNNSKGTKNMVKYAGKKGTYCFLVTGTSYFIDNELIETQNKAIYTKTHTP